MAKVKNMGGPFIMEEGMAGVFTREQADGAMPNGTRVRKVDGGDEEELTAVGTEGTILGSVSAVDLRDKLPESLQHINYAYFVEWDSRPKLAIGVIESKLERV